MKPGLSAEVYLSCIILCRGEKPTEHYIGNFLPGFITKNPTNKKITLTKKQTKRTQNPQNNNQNQKYKKQTEKKPKTKNPNKTIKNTKTPQNPPTQNRERKITTP